MSSVFYSRRTLYVPFQGHCLPSESSLISRFATRGRRLFQRLNARIPEDLRPWLRGFVAGDGRSFSPAVKSMFLKTGLYHLLVVSGLHITALTVLLTAAVSLPFRIFYASRLLRSDQFNRWNALISVAGCGLAIVYCALCGLSSGTQRALLLYIADHSMRLIFGIPPLRLRLSVALAAQLVFFPIGFLSEGSIMSWGAYLLVVEPKNRGFIAILVVQFRLLMLSVAIFGQLAIIGVFANPFVVPAFPFLLISALVYLFWPFGLIGEICLSIQSNFLDLIEKIGGITDLFPWLYLSSSDIPKIIRCFCLLVSLVWILNAWRNLSISEYEVFRKRIQ